MLSSRMASTPASSASCSWSRRSHSTCTVRPGHRSPGRGDRAGDARARARWLSFSRIQSDRLPRWLAPPPARTAAFSRLRRPGVVLRVSQMRVGPAAAATTTNRRVSVAMPDRWPRKLSAVRSPVRIDASGPDDRADRRAGVDRRRRRHRSTRPSTDSVDLREGLGRAGDARRPRRRRGRRSRRWRSRSGGTSADGQIAQRRRGPRPGPGPRPRPRRGAAARARSSASAAVRRDGRRAVGGRRAHPARCGGGRRDRCRDGRPGCARRGSRCAMVADGQQGPAPPRPGWPARRRPGAVSGSGSAAPAARPPTAVAASDAASRSTPAPSVMARCSRVEPGRRRRAAGDRPRSRRPSSAAPSARRDRSPVGRAHAADRPPDRPTDRPSPWPGSSASSTARMAPVAAADVRPASMASTTRAPNTMPSSSELDASRLAPCTPEQATSPAAHSPASDVAPSRSVTTPPQR